MTPSSLTRMAGAAALTLTLGACMDIDMEVDILSEAEAEATMVTSMAVDMYEMMQAQAVEGEEEFCADGEIVENGEMIDCTMIQSGPFDELDFNTAEDGGPSIEAIGDGQVRVTFPTGELADAMAEDTGATDDPQMQAMIEAMFEDRSITMTVTGGAIVDTNMDMSADGMSATYEIPFTTLFEGDTGLPPELFAVVQK